MADEPDKSEKTEKATPFKLEEARKKGSVVKSMEVNSLLALTAGLILLIAIGDLFIHNVLSLCKTLFLNAGTLNFEIDKLLVSIKSWVSEGLYVLSPIVVVMMIIGVLATVVQTGPNFSTFPLKPDIKRLNPIQGFKKFMSIKLLFESVKNIIKLAVFSLVLYFTISDFVSPLQKMYQMPTAGIVPFYLDMASTLIFRLIIALILIAIIDFLFTRFDYQRNLRMTRKELKDEAKRRDGDPQIRAKRKELQKELRDRSQSLTNVPDADLIITNPTHYSVVLKYDRATMVAPVVVGKGMGEMAFAIRQAGYRHNVPVIRSPSLTRLIYKKSNMDQAIPTECYAAVAKVLRQAYQQKQNNRPGNQGKLNQVT